MIDEEKNWDDYEWINELGGDELAHLFRTILKDKLCNVESPILYWENRMDRYLNDETNGIPNNTKDRSSAKGNINKALQFKTMSWKTFKTGLKFLGARSIKFTVSIEWEKDKNIQPDTLHNVKIPVVSQYINNGYLIKKKPMENKI